MATAASGKVAQFEGQAPTAKGNGRWWEVTVSPIRGPDGKPIKLLSISRDISARVERDRISDLLLREMQHRVMNTLAVRSGESTTVHSCCMGSSSSSSWQQQLVVWSCDLIVSMN